MLVTKLRPRVARSRQNAICISAILLLAACQASSPASSPGGEASAPAAAETTWERVQREGAVRIAFHNEPPFAYATLEGTITGVDPELLRTFLADYDVVMEPVLVEFPGLIAGLQAKRFDVIASGMAIRPERCEVVTFSNPTAQWGQGLLVLEGNPLDLHSYDDIVANADVVFGTLQGSAIVDYATIAGIPEDQMVLFREWPPAVAALETGRVQAIGAPTLTLRDTLARMEDPAIEEATPFTQPLGEDGQPLIDIGGIGFRPEDADFVAAFNEGLVQMREDGSYEEILTSFGFDIPDADITAEEVCAS